MPGKNAEVAIDNLRRDVSNWKAENQKIWETHWKPFAALATHQLTWPERWRN
jgi:hypothetical protein